MNDRSRGRVNSGILHLLLTILLCSQTRVVVKGGPGAFDPTFTPSVNGVVHCVLPLPDGRVIIGGEFTRVDNQVRNRIARLNSDGSLDTQFLSSGSGFSAAVRSIARQADGKLVVGGDFQTVHQQSRRGLARLHSDGSLDGTFAFQGTTSPVLSVLIQPDGRILCGGSFVSIAGVEQRYVARILSNGTLDSSFNTAAAIDGPVNSIALQPDGKVLIGGAFTRVFGLQRNRIARLNDNGSLDQSFLNGLAGPLATVRKVSWMPPENIMIAGDFTTVNGVQRARIAKLMTNGVLETTFNPNRPGGPSAAIHSFALSPDGSVFIAGDFSSVNSSNRMRIAKLHADGTLNGTFGERLPGADLGVRDVALDPSGKLIVGGLFTRINGPSTPYIARLYDDFYPPEIIRHPESRNAVVGTNILLSVLARNSTPLTYQWSKNGMEIPGATSTSYSLFNVQENDAGSYLVTLRNELGATTSSNAVIRVGHPPVIVDQPEGAVVNAGDPVEFTVSATGSTLNFAWFKGAGRINGANEATFRISSATLADAGAYRVRVTNFFGASTSSIVQLTVNSQPRIHTEPVDQEIEVGSPLLLTVEASGFPQIGYRWWRNDTLLPDATESTYASTNAVLSDSGTYFVVITNALGSITSRVAQVTEQINYWDHRANTLKAQEEAGKSSTRVNSFNARQRADELADRLKKRLAELEQERTIVAKPPTVLGGALILPVGWFTAHENIGMLRESPAPYGTPDSEVERLAMEAVMQFERSSGFIPRDVSKENRGYDIESRDPSTGKLRFIEVKGRVAGAEVITVTKNEILTSLNHPEGFLLAVVFCENGRTEEPVYLRRPFTITTSCSPSGGSAIQRSNSISSRTLPVLRSVLQSHACLIFWNRPRRQTTARPVTAY